MIFVFSAPSGAGKTSLVKSLITNLNNNNFFVPVSYTSRSMRPGDVDGVDYNFVSREIFEDMIRNDLMLEYANVYGNYYGLKSNSIEAQLLQNKNIILEIDWQGWVKIKSLYKDKAVGIFIMPPTLQELESRLKKRNKDSVETIASRMQAAEVDMMHKNEYDHIVVNDDFSKALSSIESIVNSYLE